MWHEQIVGLAYQAGLELPTEEGKFIRSVSRVMVDLVCDQNPFWEERSNQWESKALYASPVGQR